MKDALGKDLVIGQTYGYSRSDNGITTVKIGKLVKINKTMVSLEVQEAKWGTYTNDLEARRVVNKVISVKANGIFPIYPEVPVIEGWDDLQDMLSKIVPAIKDWNDLREHNSAKNVFAFFSNYLKANYPNGVIIKPKA